MADNRLASTDCIPFIFFMIDTEHILLEKIRQLPPQRVTEIEDFIDFLCAREEKHRLTQAATQASQSAFTAVWDNDEDAAYDGL